MRKTLLSMAIGACLLPTAHAELLDNMSITATKTETTNAESPSAVSVITKNDIEARNVSRVTDALSLVPSLNMSSALNGQMSQGTGAGGFTLRGMNTSRNAVLVDGMSVIDGYSSKVDFRSMFVEDIERVEVVRGASSSLYGSNAIGGVINIITKKPASPETTVKYKKGFGDASGDDLSIFHSQKLASGFGFSVGYGHIERTGYVNELLVKSLGTTAGTTPVSGGTATSSASGAAAVLVGDKGRTAWTQDNAVIKLSYDLSPKERIYGGFSYNTYQTRQDGYNSYLKDSAGNTVISGSSLAVNGMNKITLAETDFASTNPVSNASTRFNVGYEVNLASKYNVKAELAKTNNTSWYNSRTTGTFYGGAGTYNSSPSEALEALFQVGFEAFPNHYLVTGINVRNTELNREVLNLSNWRNESSTTGFAIDGTRGKSSTQSVFIQDEISLADNLTAYLGTRYDQWTTEGSNFKTGTGAYDNQFSTRNDSAFSPKVSLVYLPVKSVTLRTSVGKSFRAPDNYELYGSTFCCSRYYLSNPNLKPETATTWDLGAEWRMSSKLTTGVSLYETTLQDMIYGKTLSTQLNGYDQILKENAGEAKVKGVELTASSLITDWLRLDLAYAYTDAKITKNDAEPLTVGNQIAQTPENMWTIALAASHQKWSGLLEAKYADRVYSTESNTEKVQGVYGGYDAYTLINTRIGYQLTKEIRTSLAVNNLMDNEIYQFYLLPGRNVTAEIAAKF